MKPYSNDLRRSIVEAYENNDYSQDEVAKVFGVSPATVRNFVRRKRETGSTDALPHAGGRTPALAANERAGLCQLVTDHGDATLAELRRLVERKFNKGISTSALCRLLQALRLPLKKRRSTRPNATLRESSKRELSTTR